MSAERKGRRIVLAPDASIPDCILKSHGTSVGTETIQGKVVPTVDMKRGDAGFIGGGSVVTRTGRQKAYKVAFEQGSVLEIRTLDGSLVERNHHMCAECGALTGKMIHYTQNKEVFGTVDATFQCGQNPEHTWELKQI